MSETTPDKDLVPELPASPAELKRVLEAVLLSAREPLSLLDLRKLFADQVGADVLRGLLDQLRTDWSSRSLELLQVASGWRFRTRAEFMPYLERLNPEKPPRYSRAVLETLAIIAYRQPVTRGDFEDIRGVTVATQVIRVLEERGWVRRPSAIAIPRATALLATTRKFLDDLGLRSLAELPALEQINPTLDLLMPTNKRRPPADPSRPPRPASPAGGGGGVRRRLHRSLPSPRRAFVPAHGRVRPSRQGVAVTRSLWASRSACTSCWRTAASGRVGRWKS
jgi:segregation and condensation protein B